MSKTIKFLFVIACLIIIYGAFLMFSERDLDTGAAPELQVPDNVLKISVEDKEDDLLKGVKASDAEDGDITSKVFIESISAFDENQQRTVTYAVFDEDDNITRATRQIAYTDYEAPEINIKKALFIYYLDSTEQLKDYVSASSVVDGDLSSQISVESSAYNQDDEFYVTYSVMDSCGTTTTFKTKATWLNYEPNIDIQLSDYLIRVEKGETIYPRSYIDEIEDLGVTNESLRSDVEITDNYDSSKEGTYEFIYRINRSNGDYGITRLVVIVE